VPAGREQLSPVAAARELLSTVTAAAQTIEQLSTVPVSSVAQYR